MFFFFKEAPLIALIGDIRKSKQLKNRKEVQDKLRDVLEDINVKYESDIAAKFVITLGDEFQGLLFNEKNMLHIIQEIKMRLYPVELRYGIGIGKIVTDINSEMALGADGPGYYNARNAMETVQQNEKRNKAILTDIRLDVGNHENSQIILRTGSVKLYGICSATRTGRRKSPRDWGLRSPTFKRFWQRADITHMRKH